MTHWFAIRELRHHYKWRGVWVYLRHVGLRWFLLHPRAVLLEAESMESMST